DAAGSRGAVRDDPRDGGRRPDGHLHLPQAARGQGGRRSRDRPPPRQLGREVEIGRPETEVREPGEAVLTVEGASADGDRGTPALRDVSLTVRSGEIVAVAGV